MEINTSYAKNNPLIKPASLPEQKKIATPDGGADKQSPIAGDALTLSTGSLKLSQAASTQGVAKLAEIQNSDQARKVAEQVVSGIQNNPVHAQQLHGNLFQVNLKSLLG